MKLLTVPAHYIRFFSYFCTVLIALDWFGTKTKNIIHFKMNTENYHFPSISIARIVVCLFAVSLIGSNTLKAQISSFAEYGATVHTGDHTPLWQVSNQQGLGSIYNNTYIRGGVGYKHQWGKWKFEEKLDMVAAMGQNFKSNKDIFVQQAYVDVRYKWLQLFAGSREKGAPLLNNELSSGDMTWSGNARPIPQILAGIPDYLYILPRLAIKGEISYGWFTDNNYQKAKVGAGQWYTKSIKYHHKEGFIRIGVPEGKWQLDIGMTLDTQFGGYQIWGNGESTDLGNGWKDYFRVFIPGAGSEDSPANDREFYQGNFLGSEQIRLTHRNSDFSISAYLCNHFDDFSAMGKQNGWDGLWGIELKFNKFKPIDALVMEYLQTTNMSGPLHGLHEPEEGPVHKTGGSDNYYNNGLYPGWAHWGMMIANPLILSPIYNTDGSMSFKLNRVKALHLGWSGEISPEWRYIAKISHNRTWGTPGTPTLDILENFSAYASFYYAPKKLKGWDFNASLAMDMGDIYGDNFGFQLKIHKTF